MPQTLAALVRTGAWTGDLATVRRLVEEGVDVNVADNWGRTALSLAASRGDLAMVDLLIASGAWVDLGEHDDYSTHMTPLIEAARAGSLAVVGRLLAAGANPTLHAGWSLATAEHYARGSHPEVASRLLAAEDAWHRQRPRP